MKYPLTLRVIGVLLFLMMGLLPFLPAPAAHADAVPITTHHIDNAHTGANLYETVLNVSNVTSTTFGQVFTRTLDGQAYPQPLYVPGLTINGGLHNVVYVETEHDSVYAYDADDPTASTPLWKKSLQPAGVLTSTSAPVPNSDFGNAYGAYHDIHTEVGVTSTPVIDLSSNTMYVVALHKDCLNPATGCSGLGTGYTYRHRLHALDLLTGQEKFGGPVVLGGSVPSDAADSVGGSLTFKSLNQLQRPALVMSKGITRSIIYMAFSGIADTDPYHGWVMGYDASTLQQVSIFSVTPHAGTTTAGGHGGNGEGGIWMASQGPAVDSNGSLYIMSGNGNFDTDTGGPDIGDSFFRLDPSSTVTTGLAMGSWFTPYNQATLDANDQDLGSSGILLIPGTNLLIGGGKEGKFYVIDRTTMGGYCGSGSGSCTSTDTNIRQEFQGGIYHIHGSPPYWDSAGGTYIYIWSENDALRQYQFNKGTQLFTTGAIHQSPNTLASGMSGGMLSVSANGNATNSGIVWASHQKSGTDDNPNTVPGVLEAFNASNVSQRLWGSEDVPARDSLGNVAKFVPPLVVNGKVYQPSFADNNGPGNQLHVYGLLNPPKATKLAVVQNSSPITAGVSVPFTVTAKDNSGNLMTNYTGTVHFTSSDVQAGLPSDYTFVYGDNGVHAFNLTLKTVGSQIVTGTDTVTNSIQGSVSQVVQNAGASVLTNQSVLSQTTLVNTTFATNLQVQAKDSYGNPVSNIVVTFTAPASGASGLFGGATPGTVVTVTTDSSGSATAPTFTANGTAGTYNVVATISFGATGHSVDIEPRGTGTPVNFSMTNTAPPTTTTTPTATTTTPTVTTTTPTVTTTTTPAVTTTTPVVPTTTTTAATTTPSGTTYTYYLPYLTNQANNFTSSVLVQNSGSQAATIQAQYYDVNGSGIGLQQLNSCASLVTNASCLLNTPFQAGAQGVGVLTSNQPLTVLVVENTPYGGSAYSIGAGAAPTLIAPLAINQNLGFTTHLNIANVGVLPTTVTVTFYDLQGSNLPSATKTLTLAAHTSQTLDQTAHDSNLPTGFYGWAKLEGAAGSQLVGQVLEERADIGFVALANMQTGLNSTLYAPAIFNQTFGSFVTGANIVNPNSNPVQISITYYDNTGKAYTADPFILAPDAVAPVYQGSASGLGIPQNGLPLSFYGSATVSSSSVGNGGGSNIVMVVNEAGSKTASGSAQSGTYGSAGAGGNSVGLPVVANNGQALTGGLQTSGLTILNTSTQTLAGTISYYLPDGTLVSAATQNFSVAAHASQPFYQGAVTGLPTGFYGLAVVTQTSSGAGSMLVTTNVQSDNLFFTYTEPTS
jgi:hypothetical protein